MGLSHKAYLVAAGLLASFLLTTGCVSTPAARASGASVQESGIALGEKLFTRYCASCHSTLPDTVIVGPSLAGVATRAETRIEGLDAAAYLRNSILSPQDYIVEGFNDQMPTTFGNTLKSEEQGALVAYLLTLR